MSLEEYALYQQQDLFGLNNNQKGPYPFLLDTWSTTNNNILPPYNFNGENIIPQSYENNVPYDFSLLEDYYSHGIYPNYDVNGIGFSTSIDHEWDFNSSPDEAKSEGGLPMEGMTEMKPRRRRRVKCKKNEEDIENQRMTHIAVERNRRKQMNEYLSVLRSLMPDSYVQRGDQASIVGGAINFVKELEHKLQCLSAKTHIKNNNTSKGSSTTSLPFQEFFTFPQYSNVDHGSDNDDQMKVPVVGEISPPRQGGGEVAADVEVTMVESHANLKIRLKWWPIKQLSKLVSGLLCLRLTILHLNVNTAHGIVFYSFSLKVEDDSKMSTVDEIAGEVYNLLCRIEQDQIYSQILSN